MVAIVKFRFERIGPIEAAELELGDLTIVAGRNNTGKTYLVYTMYGFLRAWALGPVAKPLLRQFDHLLRSEVGTRMMLKRSDLDRLRHQTLEWAASSFTAERISEIFSAPLSAFAHARLAAELVDDLPSDARRIALASAGEYEVVAQYGEDVELELLAKPARYDLWRFAARRLALDIALPDIPEPFVLSAERFGIALFYKELDFAKSRLVEILQQVDDRSITQQTPLSIVDRIASRYAKPVKDNVDFTRNIENVLSQESELADAKLHDEIKNLMRGYYVSAEGVVRFKSKARKRNTFDIPLHIASSSARGLSDLYFYLRHVASKSHLLFIDEPETHLDTANQVLFARVIARLVGAGLRVLVSTHSDYLMKEINNLIMLHHLGRKPGLNKDLGYRAGEGLDGERVRAYVAEGGVLTRCEVDAFGVNMPVFDKTIDQINRVSTELAAAVTETQQTKEAYGAAQ